MDFFAATIALIFTAWSAGADSGNLMAGAAKNALRG